MRFRPRTVTIVLLAGLLAAAPAGCTAGSDGTAGSGAAAGGHRPTLAGDGVTGPAPEGAAPDRADGRTSTRDDPQSTFAVDVDTASYTYARRQIRAGTRPAASTVRAEEFVNAFDQDYPEPAGDGFAVHADGARLSSGPDTRLMRVGLQTRGEPDGARSDATLTFVVDTSGSMASRDRLPLVQDALHTLVDQLRPSDAVGIVSFSDSAAVLRETRALDDRRAVHAAIDRLAVAGSTNLEDGLVTGYRTARTGFREGTSNRVVVLSDGLANTGSTDADRILDRVRAEAAKQIALLGVGVGSDYGDAMMERLADGGDGFAVYVSEPGQARDVFVHRLPATLAVRALDAKVQVTFDPATVVSYRLIGYRNRAVADGSFRDDRVDGGEVGPGHAVTALYEVRLAEGADGDVGAATVSVRWSNPVDRTPAEISRTVRVSDLAGTFAAAGPRLQVSWCAAAFAEWLRSDRTAAGPDGSTLDGVREAARTAADRTGDPAVAELAELIGRARTMR